MTPAPIFSADKLIECRKVLKNESLTLEDIQRLHSQCMAEAREAYLKTFHDPPLPENEVFKHLPGASLYERTCYLHHGELALFTKTVIEPPSTADEKQAQLDSIDARIAELTVRYISKDFLPDDGSRIVELVAQRVMLLE